MKIKMSQDKEISIQKNLYFSHMDIALFEEKKLEMLNRIAETLYKTLFRYLDYLNHVMVVCADE